MMKKEKKQVNDLVSSYTPGKVEEEKRVVVVGQTKFTSFIKKYESFLDGCSLAWDNPEWYGGSIAFVKYMNNQDEDIPIIDEVLSSQEINNFIMTTVKYENHKDYWRTGVFISRLIQNSYSAGKNDFFISSYQKPFSQLCASICGTIERPLNISVEGYASRGYFSGVSNINAVLHGDIVSSFAWFAHDSTFLIHGLLKGYIGENTNCTFKTTNKKTLELLMQMAPKGNKVMFIHSDGGEEQVR